MRNTFDERHSYVASVLPGEVSAAGIRESRTKIFHVSPFMDMRCATISGCFREKQCGCASTRPRETRRFRPQPTSS
ncbi:DUF1365 family protein [Ensifer sp. SL37]|nr:DUF1365 family protein [Ensifer sp. SL37]MCY1745193.1 DUF1365 family protein [Ensifer sp. SL37]